MLAGLEGSPWSGTVQANKVRQGWGRTSSRVALLQAADCMFLVGCSDVVLCWNGTDCWRVGGSVRHRSSGSKTSGVTPCWHCVMQAHRMASQTAWHLWEAISLALWDPSGKVRHSKFPLPPPHPNFQWFGLHGCYTDMQLLFFFTQFRHFSCYSH
jgi:hypothetical protein